MRFLQFLVLFLLVTLPIASVLAQESASTPLTADAINAADLQTVPAEFLPPLAEDEETGSDAEVPPPAVPDPAIVKLQILLDRAGASPGVIDGFDGDNVRKAVWAFETMRGFTADGIIDAEMLAALDTTEPVVGTYTITDEDVAAIGAPIPED